MFYAQSIVHAINVLNAATLSILFAFCLTSSFTHIANCNWASCPRRCGCLPFHLEAAPKKESQRQFNIQRRRTDRK